MGYKNYFSLLPVLAGLAACSGTQNNLSIEGTVTNQELSKMYLQKFDNKMFFVIDSADVVDGKFSFSKNVTLPEIYGLAADTTQSSYMLFLDENPVTVVFDQQSTIVKGSKLQDEYIAASNDLDSMKIDEYIKQNPKSLVAAYMLYRNFSYKLSPEEIKANIQLLDTSLLKTPYVKVLEQLVTTLESVAVGKKALDFTANDPEGNPVSLYSKLGNSYLFIDFWASWCPPCRRENPNVVAAYNKFKSKGFDILAVSLDKSKEAWVAAIEKDNLTWTHVSDLRFWDSAPAAVYGIRAIPANVLLNSEGIIIAKNLYGEDLMNKLDEVYKK
jgi:Peroxiredoxin